MLSQTPHEPVLLQSDSTPKQIIENFLVDKELFNASVKLTEHLKKLPQKTDLDNNCVAIASSKEFLEWAHQSKIPTIFYSRDNETRVLYQKKYNPLYICDNEAELINLIKLYAKSSIQDISEINNDLAQPVINAKNLKPLEQEELGKVLFPVYQTMMLGRNLESFTSQFSDKRPDFIEVMTYVNKVGKPVGFIIVSGHTLMDHSAQQQHRSHDNKYMVCEVLVCILPEMQNNRHLEKGVLMILDEYHIKNPTVGIIFYDSMVNYKSYKVALKSRTPIQAAAFPRPGEHPPARVQSFMHYLKQYFHYESVGNDPYAVRTISDTKIKESSSATNDPAWGFFYNRTGNQRNVGLLAMSCYYLTENNSLALPPQSQFSYDGIMRNESLKRTSLDDSARRRELGQLFLLSMIFKKEVSNLTPFISDLPRADLTRTSLLWNYYFNRGIFLSGGGATQSFIDMNSLGSNQNLMNFNQYRSDRVESTLIEQKDMKKFLKEEKVFSNHTNLDELTFSFSLGSHEGAMRVARCIFDIKKNNGIFCATGSYGFLAASTAVMKPVPYRVHLVDIDRRHGEKISLGDLQRLIKKFRTTKTLFIELKTICGAIYTSDELTNIIKICKAHDIFLMIDAAHINMHYYMDAQFPDVIGICQELDYHNFSVIYTTSKTYGLERARVGFVVASQKISIPDFWVKMEIDLYRVNGSLGDTPFEVASLLFNAPLQARKEFLVTTARKLQFNMNLMLAYIEGVRSPNIDEHFREQLMKEIPAQYWKGIEGVTVVYKPHGGMQLKVNVAGLQHKYLANIRMSSSEIFAYALNKMANVVTLNAYQILDPEGFGMRLAYSVKQDVHHGMRAMHDFIQSLADRPSYNRFLSEHTSLDDMIKSAHAHKKQSALSSSYVESGLSRHALFSSYKRNVEKRLPRYVKLSDKQLNEAVHNAATLIQKKWREYAHKKPNKETQNQRRAKL